MNAEETLKRRPTARQWRLALWLVAVVPLGFGTKFYVGPGRVWVAYSFGGVLYEVFWCLFLGIVAPRLRPVTAAVGVFALTCLLEGLQLCQAPVLEAVRGTFLGRTLIGTTFAWTDFAYYAVGSAIGWRLLEMAAHTGTGETDDDGRT